MADVKVTSEQDFENGRNQAITFAWFVYGGVVVAATTLFISFVLSAFPDSAYFSRMIMTVAGALVGASMIAFPFALHKWAVEKTHRKWTVGLYYGEMVFVATNTFISFTALLSENAGYSAPEWAILYEPFSILAIIYTLAAWGTVFLKDPHHKAIVKGMEALQTFDDKVADKLVEFVDSVEGHQVIQKTAEHKIAQMFDAEKFSAVPKSFVGLNSDVKQEDVRQTDIDRLVEAAKTSREKAEAINDQLKSMLGELEGQSNGTDPTQAARRNGKA